MRLDSSTNKMLSYKYTTIFAIIFFILIYLSIARYFNAQTLNQTEFQGLTTSKDLYKLSQTFESLVSKKKVDCVEIKIDQFLYLEKKRLYCAFGKFFRGTAVQSLNEIDGSQVRIAYLVLNSNNFLIYGISIFLGLYIVMIILIYVIRRRQLEYLAEISFSKKVAHDIRSPLSTLNLISSRIEDQDIKDLQLAVVRQINEIAQANLDRSKLQANKGKQADRFLDLIDLLKKELAIKSENLHRVISCKSTLPANLSILRAPKFIYAGVNNLIQNSVEASVDGQRIELVFEADNSNLYVVVRDDGRGFPPDSLDKAGNIPFSFGKVNSNSGSGTALFNFAEDLRKINGELKIESVPGKGSTIKVVIPIRSL